MDKETREKKIQEFIEWRKDKTEEERGEEYNMNNNNKNYIGILNEGNSKNTMKSNCKFEDIVSVYNTLPPHEKLFLGNKFIDSPNTVFRYADIRNAEYAGFVELYDMKKNYGSHKGEVIIEVAICPQYRSIGILELLQNKAEEFVRSSTKYNKIVWYAKDANGRSIRCAEKLGYKKKFHESDHWVYEKEIK